MLTLPRAVLAAVLTSAALVVLQPSPAAALTCKSPEAVIPNAKILLTGNVVDVDPENSRLTVVVKEGWRGGPVPARALVHVDDIAATGWSAGLHDKTELYLFALRKAGPNAYVLAPCSFWNPYRHLSARPARTALPGVLSPPPVPAVEDDDEESHTGRWFLVILGFGVVLLVAASVVRRRRAEARAAARAQAEDEAEQAPDQS